ncbi:MAG TPA: pyrroloquinoline quinone biosynthesis protein PqqE [Burkholderiales bacterium]|nr:pyrroloquinoline quinone biosynthesis protein PqqE [Burkholderiales bacterium]
MRAKRDGSVSARPEPGPPLWLLAELTYRCPLHCVYCSNPVDYTRYKEELTTEEWLRVLREARELGATQLGFSGGEPLMRDDLETLAAEARRLGYYSNLITSGVGLNERRIAALKEAGLDHIQVSFQDSTREMNDFLSSTRTFELKRRVAKMVKAHGYPMVLNVVLHRLNIDHVGQILEMAAELEADYVELANTQYYGFAYANRELLLPSRQQLERAEAVTNAFRARMGERMKIFFVVPDYYANRPKACMNGWGSVFLCMTADGVALPCHEARMLPGLEFPSVRDRSLQWIWRESPGFSRYRGDEWMREPCRSCPEKGRDFGGCRCQAYLVTGEAENADPVCDKSPHHHLITQVTARAREGTVDVKPVLFYRDDETSRRLSAQKEKNPA